MDDREGDLFVELQPEGIGKHERNFSGSRNSERAVSAGVKSLFESPDSPTNDMLDSPPVARMVPALERVLGTFNDSSSQYRAGSGRGDSGRSMMAGRRSGGRARLNRPLATKRRNAQSTQRRPPNVPLLNLNALPAFVPTRAQRRREADREEAGKGRGHKNRNVFNDLARRLGESVMSRDLSIVVDLRRHVQAAGLGGRSFVAPSMVSAAEYLSKDQGDPLGTLWGRAERDTEVPLVIEHEGMEIINSAAVGSLRDVRTRCRVFLLLCISKGLEGRQASLYLPNFTGALVAELYLASRTPTPLLRQTVVTASFMVLQKYALETESFFGIWARFGFDSMVHPKRVDQIRRRKDTFAFTVGERLVTIFSAKSPSLSMLEDGAAFVTMLLGYIDRCHTRVLIGTVFEDSVPGLLATLSFVSTRGRAATSRHLYILICHRLLEVIDIVCYRNRQTRGDILLLTALLDAATLDWLESYTRMILLNSRLQEEIVSFFPTRSEALHALSAFRVRAALHVDAVCTLITRYVKRDAGHPLIMTGLIAGEVPPNYQSSVRFGRREFLGSFSVPPARKLGQRRTHTFAWNEHPLHRLDAIVAPKTGILAQTLMTGLAASNVEVKTSCCRAICKLFSVPDSPLLEDRAFIDFYVTHHYLLFVQLYTSVDPSSAVNQLITAHLSVLLAIARHHVPAAKSRFKQLRVVEFLVRECGLEHDCLRKDTMGSRKMAARARAKKEAGERSRRCDSGGARPKANVQGVNSPLAAAMELAVPPPTLSLNLSTVPRKGEGDGLDSLQVTPVISSDDEDDSAPSSSPLPGLGLTLDLGLVPKKGGSDSTPDFGGSPMSLTLDLNRVAQKGQDNVTEPNQTRPDSTDSTLGDSEQDKAKTEDEASRTAEYTRLRGYRRVYSDSRLHVTILDMVLTCLVTKTGTLESSYTTQFPMDNLGINIPHLLHHHLNNDANADILPELLDRAQQGGPGQVRLLKLLCRQLFSPAAYHSMRLIGEGAYGSVYVADVRPFNDDPTLVVANPSEVAVKLMEMPESIYERSVLHDIFSEIAIMETFRGSKSVCQLYDYGVTLDRYWVVMRRYASSVRSWREKRDPNFMPDLLLYLMTYRDIIKACRELALRGVNHFDLKCDNILMDDRPTVDLPFSVAVGDFGESKLFTEEEDGITTRNRGTEYIKAPEMLGASKKRTNFDRRRKAGAGQPADVWSLACLLFELLTCEYLYYDDDWVRFYIRVTGTDDVLPPDKLAKISTCPAIEQFLRAVLVRSPTQRPPITELARMTNTLIGELQLPSYVLDVDIPIPYGLPRPSRDRNPDHPDNLKLSYSHIVTHVTPHLCIADISMATDADFLRSLGVTRCINCSTEPNPCQDILHHELSPLFRQLANGIMDLRPVDGPSGIVLQGERFERDFVHTFNTVGTAKQGYILALEDVFDFIRGGLARSGRTLLYGRVDQPSMAAALAMAYLMDTKSYSAYHAMLQLRRLRLTVFPSPPITRFLLLWDHQRARADHNNTHGDAKFQCLCGKVFFVVHDPSPVLSCSCTGEPSACPTLSCSAYIKKLTVLYGWPCDTLLWTFGNEVTSNWVRSTELITTISTSGMAAHMVGVKQGWELFGCRVCSCITHARRDTEYGEEYAVVSNVPLPTSVI
ncbi:Protein kinase domain [Carpediemonas membranifera]|uniref:non-specific serine/threonine protein kinase n=1 Tax=Carpediemonas membranifera TaxID=201153 RepID=A0A8J6AQ03_9EUKA|nr:Protein kinase domain [Carpediemonas membranifera]|eukprot:KAG9390343.1 Protein kinase domain [Carpediemonas membranifera]